MFQKIKDKLSQLRIRAFYLLSRVFGLEGPFKTILENARLRIRELEAKVKHLKTDNSKLSASVEKFDRGVSLDVRSQLVAMDLESYGDLVWIKVGDERMLRHEVFNQIRDYMNSHCENSILVVTGPNVELSSLDDQQLAEAGLRRLLPSERN